METIETASLEDNRPFLDSIKRVGEQLRHWDKLPAFGTKLDLLQPSTARKVTVTPRMLGLAGVLILAVLSVQTFFIYSELRAQRATIEQLSAALKAPVAHPRTKSLARGN